MTTTTHQVDPSPSAITSDEAELETLRRESGDRQGPYWRGGLAAKKQARMRELIEATMPAPNTGP